VSTYLLGPFLVLLPQTYRERLGRRLEINWPRAALISGVVQAGAAMLLLGLRYVDFIHRAIQRYGDTMVEAAGNREALGRALGTLGPTTWLEYVFQPVSLLLVYLFIEGSFRLLAAVSAEQALGSLPLYLLEFGRARGAEIRRERALGPLILDEVTRSGNELRIASCRPRDTWDHLTTIEYEGEFYELAETFAGQPPRPYVYLLCPIPPGKVIRGLHHYRPDELLARKTPGT